jgi:hypothetical protein
LIISPVDMDLSGLIAAAATYCMAEVPSRSPRSFIVEKRDYGKAGEARRSLYLAEIEEEVPSRMIRA